MSQHKRKLGKTHETNFLMTPNGYQTCLPMNNLDDKSPQPLKWVYGILQNVQPAGYNLFQNIHTFKEEL